MRRIKYSAILVITLFTIFLLSGCIPNPYDRTSSDSSTSSGTTVTEVTTEKSAADTSSESVPEETTVPPATSDTTSATTAATAATDLTTMSASVINTLTGTFQSFVWGDFLHVDILGDDGVTYSFFVIHCDSEVEIETLTPGQRVTVTWQNIDKELPIGDTKEIVNIDEMLTLVLAD